MLDKISALPTQIRQLEKRLKDMDASKVSPTKLKEITDTINNLKSLLKEKQDKKEQRKKLKEQKTAETPSTEEVKVEADAITDKVEKDPKVAPHLITPDSLKEKEKIVEKIETSPEVAPAIISEQQKPTAINKKIKFDLDQKVKPIRGSESKGRVMRHDSPESLVYVYWDEGSLKDRDGFGGYESYDVMPVEEPKQEIKKDSCPCVSDMSVYCDKCKSQKTSDLKSNYMDMLKDLKDELSEAEAKHDHIWISRLQQKVKEMEEKIAEKFSNEKTAVSDSPFHCENCHAPMSPLEQSHLENLPNGDQKWTCNKKEAGHENGSGATERLTIVDHSPAGFADMTDSGEGKDELNSEFESEWAEPKIK